MKIEHIRPAQIEAKSFEIIQKILDDSGHEPLDPRYEHVIKRCIHTSADFEYVDSMYFSDGVIEAVEEAIRGGAVIVTDTNMARAGISKSRIEAMGGEVVCYIADEDVAREAERRGLTRSYVSMEKAAKIKDRPIIIAVGNAPTALFAIVDLIEKEELYPAAVIGVPVGFVNVVEAKERLIESGAKCIATRGRKGGSNIAAAIVNAVQYRMDRGSSNEMADGVK